jgi:3-oxoadipate CoA-transferase, alpha subunit
VTMNNRDSEIAPLTDAIARVQYLPPGPLETRGRLLEALGRECVLAQAIKGDLALVRADTADRYGNLAFRYAQMNFGPVMATAATLAVAEVRAVFDDPMPYEWVQLPGFYVDRVVAVGT